MPNGQLCLVELGVIKILIIYEHGNQFAIVLMRIDKYVQITLNITCLEKLVKLVS